MRKVIRRFLASLYRTAMDGAYDHATEAILATQKPGWRVLDCGAGAGGMYHRLDALAPLDTGQYFGIEWNAHEAEKAQAQGLKVTQGDLNKPLPFPDESFDCVYALSVLEHLLHGCAFLVEARRVLKPGGVLVVLTPNIATYFTAALILAGRMPSSGPHPDSNALLAAEVAMDVKDGRVIDAEGDTPVHRHLVVFSFRALRSYLEQLDFRDISGRGFGLYPAPNFTQPFLQWLDPWHCHQMVFTAVK